MLSSALSGLYFELAAAGIGHLHPLYRCQILFLPPLLSYMRHCCPINQSQADTVRLWLKNRSTRGTAHFWKPVTHDIFMEHSVFLLSLNAVDDPFSSHGYTFSDDLEIWLHFWKLIFLSFETYPFSSLCVLHTSANMWFLTAALFFPLLGEYSCHSFY